MSICVLTLGAVGLFLFLVVVDGVMMPLGPPCFGGLLDTSLIGMLGIVACYSVLVSGDTFVHETVVSVVALVDFVSWESVCGEDFPFEGLFVGTCPSSCL